MNKLSVSVRLVCWLTIRMWVAALLLIGSAFGIVGNIRTEAAHADHLLTGQAAGQITRVELENRGRGYLDYSFAYTYEIEGNRYDGLVYCTIPSTGGILYETGEAVTVWFNPEHPNDSKLPGTVPVRLHIVGYIFFAVVSGIALAVIIWSTVRKLGTMRRGIARTATCTKYYKTSKGSHAYVGYYSGPNGKKRNFYESKTFPIKHAESGIPIFMDRENPNTYLLMKSIPRGIYLSQQEQKWKVKGWRLALLGGVNLLIILLIFASLAFS